MVLGPVLVCGSSVKNFPLLIIYKLFFTFFYIPGIIAVDRLGVAVLVPQNQVNAIICNQGHLLSGAQSSVSGNDVSYYHFSNN